MNIINKQIDIRLLNSSQSMLNDINALESDQVLQYTTTNALSVRRIELLCKKTGHILMQYMDWDGEYTFFIRKAH